MVGRAVVGDGLESDATAVAKPLEAAPEEMPIGLHALRAGRAVAGEVFERTEDGDRVVGTRRTMVDPILEQHLPARHWLRRCETVLRRAERQADGFGRAMALDQPLQVVAPAAANVEHRRAPTANQVTGEEVDLSVEGLAQVGRIVVRRRPQT